MVIQELQLFSDDAGFIGDLIKSNWSLGPQETPVIKYIPESFAMDSRIGSMHIYPLSTSNNTSATDYQSIDRSQYVSIRLANRFRDTHFRWCNEVYRIIMANRRVGRADNQGYSMLELSGHKTIPDETGWYTTTFDIKLTSYHVAIQSAGFGDKINNEIANSLNNIEGQS